MKPNIFTTLTILLAAVTVTQSRRWFAREVNCWITQQKVPASWEHARRRCERDGAVLASPLNTQLFDYMQSLIIAHNHSAAYFIGTRAKCSNDSQEVRYVSVEGRRLDDMPRAVFDAVDQLDLEQGECLSMDRHGIRSVSCWAHLPYVCYSNETMQCGSAPAQTNITSTDALGTIASVPTTTTITPVPTSTIPAGYTYSEATGSYYKVHSETLVSWSAANATCASEGADLVVLNDAEEVDAVVGIMTAADYRYTWVGLRDSQPGGVSDWRTVHGEPVSEVFHSWGGSYPNGRPGWTCAAFYASDKRLFNLPCDDNYQKHYFLCEISQ